MSANEVNLNGILKADADYLAKNQTVPQNDTADGNGGSFELANTQASIEVIAEVGSVALGVGDTKVLTVKLQDSADNSSFADLQTLYTITSSGGDTIAVGTELGRFVLPADTRRYVKAVIVSTDASGTGKVNVFSTYVPR